MKTVVAREHEKISPAGSLKPLPVELRTRYVPTPNPLWAITVGMGVFFAVAAALIAAGW